MELRLLLAISCGLNLLLTCVQANKCYVARLDPNSFKESGYKGYAMRCNNTGLHEVPKIYPNASLTPPLRLLDLGTNNITRLDNMTFLNATNMNASDIWWLYLTNNSLTYISSDAFVGLTSLVCMNLTQNNLVWSSSFGRGVFKPLASLAELNLKMNIFSTFDDLDEELVYLKNLRGLFINPMSSACKLGPKFRTLENLTTLSLSAMKEDSCNMGHVTNDTFENVPTIANLWMKQCNVSSIDANALAPLKARLVTLDLSYNEELRFSDLNISHNYLQSSFDPNVNPNASWILNTPVNMTRLDMSSNALYTLPQNFFAKMEKLETLILRFNNLAKFDVTLVSKNLSYLDLYNNKLDRLNSSLTSYLDSLANSGSNVTLDIGNNKIDCSECDTLPTIKWLLTSTVTVLFAKNDVCHVGNKQFWLDTPADRKAIEDTLERKCADRTWESWAIGGGSAIIGAVIAILGGTSIYRNRWKIRYYYYNYNAYISYSKGMASNIKRVVVPVLEGQHGLKLWVTDRDLEVGKSITENIIHGICNSAKCVFLIDEGFLKEEWCSYDLNMALVESVETKRSMIIIVLMDHTLMEKLPLYIQRILQKERSLEYPEHSENLDTFWSNLADEIRS